jgi:hypothetical protein
VLNAPLSRLVLALLFVLGALGPASLLIAITEPQFFKETETIKLLLVTAGLVGFPMLFIGAGLLDLERRSRAGHWNERKAIAFFVRLFVYSQFPFFAAMGPWLLDNGETYHAHRTVSVFMGAVVLLGAGQMLRAWDRRRKRMRMLRKIRADRRASSSLP